MRDWRQVARGLGLDIPEEELGPVVAALAALERAYRPLAQEISLELEPAFVLLRRPEEPS